MAPLRRLELRSRETRNERCPSCGGMGPERLMWERFKAATMWWSELQVTPIQLQTELELVQFLETIAKGLEVMCCFSERRAV